MKKYFAAVLSRVALFMEFFISIMLAVGIILLCIRLAGSLIYIPDLNKYPNYEDLLEACFNLIIGVELIRMMYYHTPDTVFEVLLFAIARQIIIDHSSSFSSLIGVCAIAVLFATRKFLFFGQDLSAKNTFRGSSRVSVVNKIMDCRIPYESPAETLETALKARCAKEGITPREGACVYFNDTGLRVEKMNGEKITRIEVIHAIH